MNSAQPDRIQLPDSAIIDPLLFGIRWAGTPTSTSLTYSFPNASAVWATPYSALGEPSGFQPFGTSEIAAARTALQTWGRYANINLSETSETPSNVGDIRFGYTTVDDPDSAAHAYLPSGNPSAADIWLDRSDVGPGFAAGSPNFLLLLHEIGHALGLKHPFEGTPLNDRTLDPDLDSLSYTIMSYNLATGFSAEDYASSYFPTTPMGLDILAMQTLYGPRAHNGGDTQYVFNEGQDYFETIYDTGGNDTIILNSTGEFGIVDLYGGAWSALGNALYLYDQNGDVADVDIFNVMIFYDSVIENAITGAGDDEIYGNEVANRIQSGDGHDIVMGYEGNDTLLGGGGNDHLYGRASFGGEDGADSISGGDGSDYIQGNAGNDSLDGGTGSDRINGGNNDDHMLGGTGNDTMNGNVGSDTILGGGGNDSLRGGQDGDSIDGGSGNDILSGDLGADTLCGGEGIDIFVFSGASSPSATPDRILDFTDGIDRIWLGFLPTAVLTGAAQSGAAAATATAQQLFDGRAGNGEVAAMMVGGDTYLFYNSTGGATVDSALLVTGVNASLFSAADFG
ncbi:MULTISPECIES: M10 family metallopeptidase [unclassified Sphingomonas]|uniref:M10 family metallopeptidase n=1 Tax=unclassified Sphingomonas TaxID=196159 RepID=UPI0006F67475|nr:MULTISPECIES: M10 family metallopeptidase [unclassified Sphingomonas]KQX20738.1 hypothetical protein ASD17_07530 [Sphingomonas sp. Root1294]KQY68584.1 hypothetical protein ASD39_04050 [Sphingomonas sp. Root50]KRB87991.1 hypothetical protein ASE22_21225 [Sphingomonas sp. Root720]